MKQSIPIYLFLILLFESTLLPYSESLANERRNRPESIAELEQEIEAILEEHDVPGAAVALFTRDERLWIGGFGLSDVAEGTPVTPSTIFRWGSVSKSIVAVSVQMLAERGLIDLDGRLSDCAPEIEFENRWESTDPVRLVHCLEHTTGFDDLRFRDCAVNDPDIALIDALAINPDSRRSRWKPGTYKSYCNVGPAIAAHVVATVSGQSFEEFVDANVFGPLGMETSSFYFPDEAELMAKGYGSDGMTEVPYDHIALRPAGSLNSSVEEIARFTQMLMNRGSFEDKRLLEPESVTRMEKPITTLAARAGLQLGYGLGNYTTVRSGYVFHGHGGMVAGFVASYGYNVDLDRGYAISINKVSDRALQRIIEKAVEFLAVGIDEPGLQATAAQPQDLLPLTGYYQSATPMTELLYTLLFRFVNIRKVTEKDGVLYSGNFLFGKQRELTPISRNAFYREFSNESLIFIEDGGNRIISYDSLRGNFKKVPTWRVFGLLGMFILSFLIMISSLIFGVIWAPRRLLGRLREERHLKARLFSLLAVMFFLVTYISLTLGLMAIELDKTLMARLGLFSFYSLGIFISSLCFALFSFLGLFFSLRALPAGSNRAAHIHSMLVSIVNVIAVVYLWFGDVIGIMTWSY